MKNNKLLIIFIFLLSVLFICYITLKNDIIEIRIVGKKEVTLTVGNEYNDELFEVININKKISLDKVKYTVNTELDINKLGSYVYEYEVHYNNKTYTAKRIINVIDDISPEIIVDDNKFLANLCTNKKNSNEYTATDNYDGNITDQVIKEISKNGIKYIVTDSSGNTKEVFKESGNVDIIKPIITLVGNNPMYIKNGEEYKEPGYYATDNCYGNIKDKVEVTNNIDINTNGSYQIKYTVSDLNGNSTTIIRDVVVGLEKDEEIALKEREIEDYITNHYTASVIYYNLNNGYQYAFYDQKVYYGASLIKTVAALYSYEKMELNDELISIIEPTIMVSNNTTYAQLVKKIGINKFKEYASQLGIFYAKDLSDSRYYINTTGTEQLIIWQKLWSFINNNQKGQELKKLFINDYSRFIDFDDNVETMHKYGYAAGCFHDVGIIFDENPYIVIILTKEANNNYSKIINDLSKKVYELHKVIKNKNSN